MAKKKIAEKVRNAPITSSDLKDALHTIFPPAKVRKDADGEVDGLTFYTVKGKQNRFDEDDNPILDQDGPDAFARKRVTNGRSAYSIKFDGRVFYDPYGIYSSSERGVSKVPGLQKWRFVSVNKAVFTAYLRFLKTKNTVHLDHALREYQ